MHKKKVRGRFYYYTTIRNGSITRSVYLGKSFSEAKKKEQELFSKTFSFNWKIFFTITLVLFLLGIGVYYDYFSLTGFATLTTLNQTDFDAGESYNNTFYNTTGEYLQLPTGIGPDELPNDCQDDGWINMTGNWILYHFNNDSNYNEGNESHIYDYSGNNNNATAYGAFANLTDYKLGSGAYSFNGSTDYIEIIDAVDPTAYTLAAWVNPIDLTSVNIICRTTGGWAHQLYLDASSRFVHYSYDGGGITITGTTTAQAGKWYHVVGTAENNGVARLYINGVEEGTFDNVGTLWTGGSSWHVGNGCGEVPNFNGAMDELMIFNRSLSANEIWQLYQRTKGEYGNTSVNNPRTGNYTSQIFDAGGVVNWSNISWVEGLPYGEELPADQVDELNNGVLGGANMTGNLLLLHLNNDSSYGENDTHVYDFSGNQNNGTAYDGAQPNLTDYKLGSGAFEFDGIDDYVNVPHTASLNPTSAIVVEAWVNPSSVSGNQWIVAKGDGVSAAGSNFALYLTSTYVDFDIYSGDSSATGKFTTTINANTWYHVVGIWDGSKVNVYLNGVQGETIGSTISINTNAYDLRIGNSGGTGYFNGTIDEFAMWNRSLSASEVMDIYKRGVLRLNVTVKSCDDSACSGESWNETYTSTPSDLSVDNNQYFQYMVDLESDNETITPELYNVTVDYDDVSSPVVSLNHPADSATFSTALDFNYTATDPNLDSCELWGNWTTGWHLNESFVSPTSGVANGSSVLTLEDGVYVWTVYCNDTGNNYNNTVENRTLTVDATVPVVNLDNPVDYYNETVDRNVTFNYTATDPILDTCELWGNWTGTWHLNESFVKPTSGETNGSSNVTIEDGNFIWSVWCNDTLGNSVFNDTNYTITIEVPPVVNLVFPADNALVIEVEQIFNCSMTDPGVFGVTNLTLYIWNSTAEVYTNTTNLTEDFNQTSWEYTWPFDDTFTWNCLGFDLGGNSAWSQEGNYTVTVDSTLPGVNFTSPTSDNGASISISSTTINVTVSENVSVCALSWDEGTPSLLGDGSYGALTVTSADTVVNNYTYLMENVTAGDTTLAVNDSSEFLTNDEVLIIQVQNSSGGIPGQYEFADISSISGNSITLVGALNYNYFAGGSNQTDSTVTQIVKVPHFTSLTVNSGASITAHPWNGTSGGIVVFRANDVVSVAGSINVTGKGFRGGLTAPSTATNYLNGYTGESTYGYNDTRSATTLAYDQNEHIYGGGGAGNGGNGGGGGGCYASAGTNGVSVDFGRGGSGATTLYGTANLSLLNFGGGGASAGSHRYGRLGAAGGDGGGIIIFYAVSLDNSGSIIANGSKGTDGVYAYDLSSGGGGGGGAGGSIFIATGSSISNTGNIESLGGTGGIKELAGGNGGDGGNGIIRLDFIELTNIPNPAPYNGTSFTNYSMTVDNLDAYTSANYTLTGLTEGSHNYSVWCKDNAGNINATETRDLIMDTTSPVISLNHPADSATFSTALDFNYTATDASLGTCELWGNWTAGWHLNESFVSPTSGLVNGSSVLILEDGVYVWTVYCNDTGNNYNNTVDNFTLTVDLTAPLISLDSPVDFYNETVLGSFVFNYTANDTNGIDSCELWGNWTESWHLNESYYTSLVSGEPYNSSNITIEDGLYVWTVYCNDTGNNYNNTVENFTLTVDLTAPLVGLDYPADFYNETTTGSVVFNFTANDSLSSLDTCELWGNWSGEWHLNETYYTNLVSGEPYNSSNITIEDGLYVWSVYCNDSWNNRNVTVHNYTLTVDLTSPSLTVVSPLNNTADADGLVYFNYTAVDALVGLDCCWLTIDGLVNMTNSSSEVPENFTVTLTQGGYVWNVSCNDTLDNVANSDTYDLSIILATEFSGDTTDLSNVNISNITNLVIELPSDGRINFTDDVGLNSSSDLDAYVNISFNRIEVNSTALSELNKAAKLYLYNLTFTNPRLLQDGSVCASSICTKTSYTSGTLEFTVTGFTTYSAGETPTTTTDTTTTTPSEVPRGTDSGAPPSPTEFSSTTNVDVSKGELVALTTAQGAKFLFNDVEHLVDIKEIGEDYVRLWVYSEPIEVVLKVGKRVSIDVDSDGFADIRIELRSIQNNNAFLYFKKLEGMSKIGIPTGQQMIIEEQFEPPKISLSPQDLILEKLWQSMLQNFQNFTKNNINHWIEKIKTKKSWQIPIVAITALLLLIFLKRLSFYKKKKLATKL